MAMPPPAGPATDRARRRTSRLPRHRVDLRTGDELAEGGEVQRARACAEQVPVRTPTSVRAGPPRGEVRFEHPANRADVLVDDVGGAGRNVVPQIRSMSSVVLGGRPTRARSKAIR